MDERLLNTNVEGENGRLVAANNMNHVSYQPYPPNSQNVILADETIVPTENLHAKALKNLEKYIFLKHLVLLVAFAIPSIAGAISPYSSGYVVFWNVLAAIMQLIAIFQCLQRYNIANEGPKVQLVPNVQLGSYAQLNLPVANVPPTTGTLICYVITFKIIGKIAILTVPILWWDWYNDCQNHYVNDLNEDSDPMFGIGEIMATSLASLITFFIVNINKVYYDRFALYNLNLWCGGYFCYFSKNYYVLNNNAVWSPTHPITTYQKIATLLFFISYLTVFIMVGHQINAMKAYINSD